MFRLFLSILFISLLSSCHLISKPSDWPNRETARETASQVTPFEFRSVKTERLKKYPEIYNSLKTFIKIERKEIENQAKEYQNEFPAGRALLPFKLSIDNIADFNQQDLNVESARVSFYTYTGGVHGMGHHISWNWSNIENRFLSLTDYIKSPAELENFRSQVKRALLAKIDPGFRDENWIDRGLTELDKIKTWNIDQNQIVLIFPPYQLAPYAAGSIEVSVPRP